MSSVEKKINCTILHFFDTSISCFSFIINRAVIKLLTIKHIMSSPWAKITKPEVSLQDVMSEQLAAKENKKYFQNVIHESANETLKDEATCLDNYEIPEDKHEIIKADELIESDAEIARTLQAQFDKEHDEILKRCENKFNGGSKVSISFQNYRASCEEESDDELLSDYPEPKDWDRFETMDKQMGTMPVCGYKMQDGVMVTKHDATINGRNNARKLLSFPPEFQTGDGENIDLQLPNRVYNRLKIYSRNSDNFKRHKIRDNKEDRATHMFGLDVNNCLHIYRMVNDSEILEEVDGLISIGKEAAIFHAYGNSQHEGVPRECAIKVFKTTLSEFKDREKYIKSDHRFKDRIGKQTSKKTVHIWAEKELANLCRLKKVGIPCPDVVFGRECVLVMSFIGKDRVPADKLKDAVMSPAEYILAYDQVTSMMKTLFLEAKLIHADLSEYNILWYEGQCYMIDVSQSVEPIHENAFAFLYRDCENITTFFNRKSVPGVVSANELFRSITGYNFEDKEELLKLQCTEKPKPHTMDRIQDAAEFNFDHVWSQLKTCQDVVEKATSLVKPVKA